MKSMTLKNIHEWPLMTRLLLLGLIFFAAFYLGYRMALSNLFSKLMSAEQTEKDTKQELEFVIHKNKVMQAEVAHLPQLQKELEKWKKQLVNYQDLPELLNQILKLGADNHLFFSSFTPGEAVIVPVPVQSTDATENAQGAAQGQPDAAAASAATVPDPNAPPSMPAAKQNTFTKVPIKIVVVGNYHEVADFISQVANLPWIVVIGNFTITTEDQTSLLGDKLAKQAVAQNLLSAEMVLDVYNLPESK